MRRTTSIMGAAVLVAGLCGPARADEKPWHTLPTAPVLQGKNRLSLLTAGENGEVWVGGREWIACAEIQLPPLGTTSVCTFDATVHQWTGGQWVDRKPPGSWRLRSFYMDASAPSNLWISGERIAVQYLARWDGANWHRVRFIPDCIGAEPIKIAPVGTGDEMWGVAGSDCIIRYRNGSWTTYLGLGTSITEVYAAGPNDVYFRVGAGAGTPDKIMRWNGTVFSDFPSPTGSAQIAAVGSSGVYFDRGSQGVRRLADGATTDIPHPGVSGIQGYKIGGDGTLWAFGNTSALRWDGTAWHSSTLPDLTPFRVFDPAPDSPDTAWALGTDAKIYTNG